MYALLTNKTIVRVVGERSLDNVYMIMRDKDAPYDENQIETIDYSEVIELERNIKVLELRC